MHSSLRLDIRLLSYSIVHNPWNSLIPLSRGSFDVLVGMDRLSKRKIVIVCHEKVVRIPLKGDEILRVHGKRTQGVVKTLLNMKSNVKDKILTTPSETSKVENAPAEMLRDLDQQMEKRANDGSEMDVAHASRKWISTKCQENHDPNVKMSMGMEKTVSKIKDNSPKKPNSQVNTDESAVKIRSWNVLKGTQAELSIGGNSWTIFRVSPGILYPQESMEVEPINQRDDGSLYGTTSRSLENSFPKLPLRLDHSFTKVCPDVDSQFCHSSRVSLLQFIGNPISNLYRLTYCYGAIKDCVVISLRKQEVGVQTIDVFTSMDLVLCRDISLGKIGLALELVKNRADEFIRQDISRYSTDVDIIQIDSMKSSVAVWYAFTFENLELPPQIFSRCPTLRRKPLEFEEGDQVLLKVSPWKGVVRFGKKGKLTLRYVGEILKRIGPVAYRLRLPKEGIEVKFSGRDVLKEGLNVTIRDLEQVKRIGKRSKKRLYWRLSTEVRGTVHCQSTGDVHVSTESGYKTFITVRVADVDPNHGDK
ncbi:hypothetical protein Tco_1281791 [Tanacetum coccineum]